jgi:hypothetical protein
MSDIVIVDTNVFGCILNLPGEDNIRREQVIAEFLECRKRGDFLILPISTIIETGNWVARLADGQHRRKHAERFVQQVLRSLRGQSPFRATQLLDGEELLKWIAESPDYAMQKLEMADFTLIKEVERQASKTLIVTYGFGPTMGALPATTEIELTLADPACRSPRPRSARSCETY